MELVLPWNCSLIQSIVTIVALMDVSGVKQVLSCEKMTQSVPFNALTRSNIEIHVHGKRILSFFCKRRRFCKIVKHWLHKSTGNDMDEFLDFLKSSEAILRKKRKLDTSLNVLTTIIFYHRQTHFISRLISAINHSW